MASNKVFLPCEFCNKMIVLENVYTHQTECQTKNDFLNKCDGENNILLPCEFCEIPTDLNNLICHQIICRKKLKNIKNRAYIAEKTESSLNSKNMMLSSVDETSSFQDKFNPNLSSSSITKNSVQKNSCNLDLNLPSTSKNYAVPTLVLRKPKVTDDHLYNSSLSLNQSIILPVECNLLNTNSVHVTNVKNKYYNDRSPFISLYGKHFQNDSTSINVTYSEHNFFLCIICRLKCYIYRF